MRQCGVLLHITSLPSRGGIGTLGREACDFVDFLHAAGFRIWQVLPIGPTGYGESPYQSGSTYAGNPMLIDLETLVSQGLMNQKDIPYLPDSSKADFEAVKKAKSTALRACYEKCQDQVRQQIQDYRSRTPWLKDYALYAALKEHFDMRSWMTWPDDIRCRRPEALLAWEKKLKHETDYQSFLQYLFDMQWRKLKEYANAKGIRLFGDIPIYVAEDSADTWAHPECFQMDRDLRPVRVAGVPPDYFCADGQLWGNPLYNWRYMYLHGFDWWLNRLKGAAERYDMLRIDHFIGFANYYSIPYGAKNARNGKWVKSPGKALFRKVLRELPDLNIIAEDLGEVGPRVKKLLEWSGLPGMKVLQFAFSGGDTNQHLPSYYTENAVAYTGTHDNDTTRGFWLRANEEEKKAAHDIMGSFTDDEAVSRFIETVLKCKADTAVIPMQDLLDLDNSARMNMPGTLGGNWLWRMTREDFDFVQKNAPVLHSLLKGCDRI